MLTLYVALGGAFGAAMRYALSQGVSGWLGKSFPYGTLTVNVLGALLMGIALGLILTYLPKGKEFHAFIVIGTLGGFTTFSSFTFESYLLVERGEWMSAGLYMFGSIALSLVALLGGMWLFKVVAG